MSRCKANTKAGDRCKKKTYQDSEYCYVHTKKQDKDNNKLDKYCNSLSDLTLDQKRFLKEYIETGNGTQSALKVYDTDDYFTAASIAHENLKKPQIQRAFLIIMEKVGLTEMRLAKKINEGLDAVKIKKEISGYDGDGKPIYETIEEEDQANRHKFVKTVLNLRGLLEKSKGTEININNQTSKKVLKVDFGKMSKKDLREFLRTELSKKEVKRY